MQQLINQSVEIGKAALTVIGALGSLCTLLAHLPLPARSAAWFARFGAASSKFAVTQRSEL